jgi:hypothetical protein
MSEKYFGKEKDVEALPIIAPGGGGGAPGNLRDLSH